ncbi:hypothetical protein BFG04_03790 [Campylobacter pinnipediorum subsp. pinnipediorum]|uniref:Restriction endonuclease n=1 Tax=Campylobacter pinnipediorum subsp. pinnipediorum TaxID=1660067 RepID=A0AAX0L9U3_9BACT|nr:hypothetical protein [Campylobacter pinnipediorum]OPA77227.1 hypothetical protein BFG04_03790 [Campylobacter pinnipediorum subsp. pinnipediorum]
MNIQVLTNSNNFDTINKKQYTLRKVDEAMSFNEFDFNIIDLNHKSIWEYDHDRNMYSPTKRILKTLPNIINNNKTSKILVILPQDIAINNHILQETLKIKDILKDINIAMINILNLPIKLEYENSITNLRGYEFSSDFIFDNCYNYPVILKSKGGNDVLIRHKNNNDIFITTIKIYKNNISEIIDFLQCSFNKSEPPAWIKDIEIFNDKSLILKKEELEKNIKSIQQDIDKNNAIRSILYSTGDELVVTIIDILHDIFSVDKNFNDVKKEDFRFEFKDFTFMIEIKGIKDNVSNKNIAQCKKFVSDLISSNENINPSNTKGILIINSQRDKSPLDRDNIHEQQISYAKRENILTITTFEFLKLYDTYKKNKIDANKCFEIFRDMIGEFKFENTKDLKNDT